MITNKSQNRILTALLQKGEASKKELSFEMGLTPAALSIFARPLIENGLIRIEGKKGSGKAGRKEEMLRLNGDYGYFLGCDVKQRSITITTMDFAGNLDFERKCQSIDEASDIINAIVAKQMPLSVAITHRKSRRDARIDELLSHIALIPPPILANNVETLAEIYSFKHPEQSNFLLVKYGPGVGSAIYVNGAPILRKNGTQSEIGHAFLHDGHRLEEDISFSALLNKEIEEREGAEIIYGHRAMLDKAEGELALALVNADALLALDKIVFAGILLSKDDVRKEIASLINELDPSFDIAKIEPYPDYDETNRAKACLLAFLRTFE